jgi:hypothetical protein
MLSDIDSISPPTMIPAAFEKARGMRDRLQAAAFFRGEAIAHLADQAQPLARRHTASTYCIGAAVAALTSSEEAFRLDIVNLGLLKRWFRCKLRRQLLWHPLVAVFRELPNYGTHVAFRPGDISEIPGGEGATASLSDQSQPFFSPIDWEDLSRLRAVKIATGHVREDMLAWFNRQALRWSAVDLIAQAYHVYVETYREFLAHPVCPIGVNPAG